MSKEEGRFDKIVEELRPKKELRLKVPILEVRSDGSIKLFGIIPIRRKRNEKITT